MSKSSTPTPSSSEDKGAWSYIRNYLYGVIDLKHGVDAQATITDIRQKSSLAGANAWMLMCSIVIASIGLSQDSPAVIIGAMLISPLMSPILGVGLSIGINDMQTLRTSLIHFGIAIVIAILTSSLYFIASPFDDLTSEINARTTPTFLDVFVAVFGGFAGIISIARKDISTTIPGVAIATALMPPLCVTGYGLAQWDLDIAYKSFYLFFLNTFFVALATYLIVRFLDFPSQRIKGESSWKNRMIIIAFSMALTIPSILIFRKVVLDQRFLNSFSQFKSTCLGTSDIYLDDYITGIDSLGHKTLYLKVYGSTIKPEDKNSYLDCLKGVGISDYELEIIPTSDVDLHDVELIQKNIQQITSEIQATQVEVDQRNEMIKEFYSSVIDTVLFDQVTSEIHGLFPDLETFGFGKIESSDFSSSTRRVPTAIVKWKVPVRQVKKDQVKLKNYLQSRFQLDSISVITSH
jgi:TIGR00341 family protein